MQRQGFTGELEDRVDQLERIVDRYVEFGHPNSPTSPTTSTLAGDNAALDSHNGLRDNILGSWVEVEVENLDTAVTFNHNLNLDVSTGEVNCRWFLCMLKHDGKELNLWDDMRGPATAAKPGATSPTWNVGFAGGTFIGAWHFTSVGGGPDERLDFVFQIPHTYKEGTDIEPHVHWSPAVAGAAGNEVRWELEYTIIEPGGTFPVPGAAIGGHVIGVGDITTQWDHMVTPLTTITGTNFTVSEVIVASLSRNRAHGNDTLASDAALLELDFHYEKNSSGSDGEFSKTDPTMSEGSVSVGYDPADSGNILANSIDLRLYGPRRVVDNTHPIKITLFFIPAMRG